MYWGAPGSTGTVDEASDGLYEFSNATLRFKSGQTGTIVARYAVAGIAVENPDFNNIIFSYGYGPGVSFKLMRVLQCGGYVEEIASWAYYFEVTLTRTSTSTSPQFHHVQLHG